MDPQHPPHTPAPPPGPGNPLNIPNQTPIQQSANADPHSDQTKPDPIAVTAEPRSLLNFEPGNPPYPPPNPLISLHNPTFHQSAEKQQPTQQPPRIVTTTTTSLESLPTAHSSSPPPPQPTPQPHQHSNIPTFSPTANPQPQKSLSSIENSPPTPPRPQSPVPSSSSRPTPKPSLPRQPIPKPNPAPPRAPTRPHDNLRVQTLNLRPASKASAPKTRSPVNNVDLNSTAVQLEDAINDNEAMRCEICLQFDGSEDDPIVGCDGKLQSGGMCIAVHKKCYGILKVPEGDWFCDRCQSTSGAEIFCVLCKKAGGPLKKTNDAKPTYAHPECVYWLPEWTGGELGRFKVDSIKNNHPEFSYRKCDICKIKGAGVDCAFPSCSKAAHPHCARHITPYGKRWLLCVETRTEDSAQFDFEMYCNEHRGAAKSKVHMCCTDFEPPRPESDSSNEEEEEEEEEEKCPTPQQQRLVEVHRQRFQEQEQLQRNEQLRAAATQQHRAMALREQQRRQQMLASQQQQQLQLKQQRHQIQQLQTTQTNPNPNTVFAQAELERIVSELNSATAFNVCGLFERLKTKRIDGFKKPFYFLPEPETSLARYLMAVFKKFENKARDIDIVFQSLKDKISADNNPRPKQPQPQPRPKRNKLPITQQVYKKQQNDFGERLAVAMNGTPTPAVTIVGQNQNQAASSSSLPPWHSENRTGPVNIQQLQQQQLQALHIQQQSLAQPTGIDRGPTARACKNCGEIGHNIRTCSKPITCKPVTTPAPTPAPAPAPARAPIPTPRATSPIPLPFQNKGDEMAIVLLLEHASACEGLSCAGEPFEANCVEMKSILRHFKECPNKLACDICRKLGTCIAHHSVRCTSRNCRVALCASDTQATEEDMDIDMDEEEEDGGGGYGDGDGEGREVSAESSPEAEGNLTMPNHDLFHVGTGTATPVVEVVAAKPFTDHVMNHLQIFIKNLKGGYVNRLYLSVAERRKLAEGVDLGSPESNLLTVCELTQEEYGGLPSEYMAMVEAEVDEDGDDSEIRIISSTTPPAPRVFSNTGFNSKAQPDLSLASYGFPQNWRVYKSRSYLSDKYTITAPDGKEFDDVYAAKAYLSEAQQRLRERAPSLPATPRRAISAPPPTTPWANHGIFTDEELKRLRANVHHSDLDSSLSSFERMLNDMDEAAFWQERGRTASMLRSECIALAKAGTPGFKSTQFVVSGARKKYAFDGYQADQYVEVFFDDESELEEPTTEDLVLPRTPRHYGSGNDKSRKWFYAKILRVREAFVDGGKQKTFDVEYATEEESGVEASCIRWPLYRISDQVEALWDEQDTYYKAVIEKIINTKDGYRYQLRYLDDDEVETRVPPTLMRRFFESTRTRMLACRRCANCLKQDCGTCTYCLDRPKFGGGGTMKQRCKLRMCHNKQKPSALGRKRNSRVSEFGAQKKDAEAAALVPTAAGVAFLKTGQWIRVNFGEEGGWMYGVVTEIFPKKNEIEVEFEDEELLYIDDVVDEFGQIHEDIELTSEKEFKRSNKLFGRASILQAEKMLIVVCKKCKKHRRLLKNQGSKISKFWKCGDAGLRELDAELNFGDRGLYECGKFPSAELSEIFGHEGRGLSKGEEEEDGKNKEAAMTEEEDDLYQRPVPEVTEVDGINIESFVATASQQNLRDDVGGLSLSTVEARTNDETLLAKSRLDDSSPTTSKSISNMSSTSTSSRPESEPSPQPQPPQLQKAPQLPFREFSLNFSFDVTNRWGGGLGATVARRHLDSPPYNNVIAVTNIKKEGQFVALLKALYPSVEISALLCDRLYVRGFSSTTEVNKFIDGLRKDVGGGAESELDFVFADGELLEPKKEERKKEERKEERKEHNFTTPPVSRQTVVPTLRGNGAGSGSEGGKFTKTTEAKKTTTAKFSVGEKVHATWQKKGKQTFPGTIYCIHVDGTYGVNYDDNEVDSRVEEGQIRTVQAVSSTRILPASRKSLAEAPKASPKKRKAGEKDDQLVEDLREENKRLKRVEQDLTKKLGKKEKEEREFVVGGEKIFEEIDGLKGEVGGLKERLAKEEEERRKQAKEKEIQANQIAVLILRASEAEAEILRLRGEVEVERNKNKRKREGVVEGEEEEEDSDEDDEYESHVQNEEI